MYARLTEEELSTLRERMKRACKDKRQQDTFGEGWEIRFDILKERAARLMLQEISLCRL